MRAALIILLMLTAATATEPRSYPATISKVLDGDTIRAKVDLGFGLEIEETFRLAGIDAPELRKPGGPEAREALIALLKDKPVRITVLGREKFGRWLARIVAGDVETSGAMINTGHARAYEGGRR